MRNFWTRYNFRLKFGTALLVVLLATIGFIGMVIFSFQEYPKYAFISLGIMFGIFLISWSTFFLIKHLK